MPKKPPSKRGPKRPDPDSDEDDSSVDSKGNIRNLIDYDYKEETGRPKRKSAIKARERIRRVSVSSDSESGSGTKVRKGHIAKTKTNNRKMPERPKRGRKEENTMNDESDDTTYEEDSESEYEETSEGGSDEEEEGESDGETEHSGTGRIGLMISSFGAPKSDPNKPKKYKMKEQPQNVQRFVKLVQKESANEEAGHNIDKDITYFKGLTQSKQNLIIEKMERKFSMDVEEVPLKFKILEKEVPQNIERVAMAKYLALMNMEPSSSEYYKGHHWIDGYSNIPFGVYRDLPVKIDDGPEACAAFVSKVRQQMETAIYGHDEAKLQILQFVSNWIANPKGAGNVLSIHGPMGVGKTTLVKEGVAKALERPFHFISLGGATDASFLDGHSYTYEGSTWGRIVDILIQSKCMNPIIYFDELDKISDTPKGEEIMNLLIHLTDGSQNDKFQDKYFTGIDLDLSRCLFIFSHNNNERVNPILRDRMYNIKVEGFNLKQKLVIAEQYLMASALRDVGLHEKVSISKDIIQYIVENFTGDEKGVRELKRCFQTIMSKLNLLRFYNNPAQVPFAITDFALPFILKKEHVSLFLKKKEGGLDPSIAHIYT
jgi:ATP-dependent Lon protease